MLEGIILYIVLNYHLSEGLQLPAAPPAMEVTNDNIVLLYTYLIGLLYSYTRIR